MRKAFAAFAAVALAAALCGCSSGSQATNNNTASQAATNNASTQVTANNTSTPSTSLSDEAYQEMNDAIVDYITDEWDGYDRVVSVNEGDSVVQVFVGASSGTKDTLLNGSETALNAWNDLKEGVIAQNEKVRQLASAIPGVHAEMYLIEDMDVSAVNEALESGPYAPEECLLYAKDSAIVYDCVAAQ